MIRFGPAGIPLSCKGRTIRDGIEDIHALGLHSMEIQLVRGKYVDELDDFERIIKNKANLKNIKAPSSYALQFLILTAARTSEVRGATWDEIDEKNKNSILTNVGIDKIEKLAIREGILAWPV